MPDSPRSTPTLSVSEPARSRRPDVQGLRGIAVMMVVLFHAGLPAPGGFTGVDVFFVISGFVITAMLDREWTHAGKIDLRRFYWRRFKRLFPALSLVLSFTMIAGVFLLSPLGTQQDAARTSLGTLLLGANLVIARITGGYFDLDADSNALLNTWSLSVEEQFYLMFPLALVVGWILARRGARAAPVAMVALVGIGSLVAAILGALGYVPPVEGWLLGFYSPATRAWEFAIGALLALLRVSITRRHSGLLGLLGFGLLVASLFWIDQRRLFPGPITFLPVCGTALLLLAGGETDYLASRLLSTPALVRIGDWSYSIYLWHWPLIAIAGMNWPEWPWIAPTAAIVSFAPAVASYYLLEEPLRHYEPAQRSRQATLIIATIVIPALLSLGLWQASSHGFWQQDVQAFQRDLFAKPEGCSLALTDNTVDECTRNSSEEGPRIYLVGDSNAGQFAEGLVIAGRRLHRPVVISTTNACPFLAIEFRRISHPDFRNSACRDHVQTTMAYLQQASPGLVMIANIDSYWMDDDYAVGIGSGTFTDTRGKLSVLRQGLGLTLDKLTAAGHRVVVVQTIPRWIDDDVWRTDACNLWQIQQTRCNQSMSVTSAIARQGMTREAIAETVAGRPFVTLLDPWHILCSQDSCATQGTGYPRYYRDGSHISVREGREFSETLVAAIQKSQG